MRYFKLIKDHYLRGYWKKGTIYPETYKGYKKTVLELYMECPKDFIQSTLLEYQEQEGIVPIPKNHVTPISMIQECEECDGNGVIIIGKLYPNGYTEVMEECPNCNGDGCFYTDIPENYEIY